MFDNSDDYDFSPAESSKLASLFGPSALSGDGINSSLKYTAPKQPSPPNSKGNESLKPAKPQTSIILAKVVFLWKLEGKDYKALGKHGLAIIGSQDLKIYEVIAYKEKTNVILRTRLNSEFKFHIQKDYFSSFYDSNSQNWLVKFEPGEQKDFSDVLEKHGAELVLSTKDESAKPDLLPKPTTEEHNSDSSGSLKRSNILHRMAKMGQQILPKQPIRNTSTDLSDTELDDTRNERKITRKFKHSVPTEKNQQLKKVSDDKQVATLDTSSNSSTFPPAVNTDLLTHFIVSQNTELKMHLSQMSAKLDSALMGCNKNSPPEDNNLAQSKIKALQLKLENTEAHLKDFEKKYMRLEIRYEDLAKKQCKESEVERLEAENSALRTRLGDFESMKLSLEDKERVIEGLKLRLQSVEELEEKSERQGASIEALNETVAELRGKLREIEGIDKERAEARVNVVKANMNEMYASVLESFDRDQSYTFTEIQATVAKYLKSTSFRMIDGLNEVEKNCPTDLNS